MAALIMALAAAAGAVAYGTAAGAAPRSTITQVQAQVNSLQAQVDQVGQQYDAVTQQVTAARARLASVQREDGKAAARYRAAQGKLRQVAVASFETANQSSIVGLLTAGDPSQVLQQGSLLQELGHADSGEVAQYLSAAQQVTTAQAAVKRTEQGIAGLQAQLAAKKAHLDKLLSAGQAELDSLNLQQQQAVAAASVGGGGYITHATYTGPTSTPGEKAVEFAYKQLDCPYLWGGTGPCQPGFDCSGLVQAAWAFAGVSIPRDTYEQVAALPAIPKADLQPGDLLFFNGDGHVAMYVGNGMMIDAPRTGEVIRLLPVDSDWYAQTYQSAARP